MLKKGNVTIGVKWRFGADWPGQRCGAKTRQGTGCQRPANKKNGRCRLHGGASTGPRTKEGRARVSNTTRGTNDHAHCSHLIYLYDQCPNQYLTRWLGNSSRCFTDAYALTELIQWVWRSQVRKGKPITVYIPSPRMRMLFEEWLNPKQK